MTDINGLRDILEFNRAQEDADSEDVANLICPHCAWNLDINSRGQKSCPICGQIWR